MTLIFEDQLIIIRNSERTNTYKPQMNVQVKVAMDSTLYSYANPNLEIIQEFKIRELDTCGTNKIDIFNFFANTMGKKIWLKDHADELWLGRVITDPQEIVAESRTSNSFSFQFEGNLNDGN